MPYQPQKQQIEPPQSKIPHKITMINRTELVCEGVAEIFAYDENEVLLKTSVGLLQIGGVKLSISSLSVESGEVRIFGSVRYLEYKTPRPEGGSLFKRLTR